MKKPKKGGKASKKQVLLPDINVVAEIAREDMKASWTKLISGLRERKWPILVVLLGSCFWLALATPRKPSPAAEDAARCRQSLSCLVQAFGESASSGCSHAVESSAKNGVEWNREGADRWEVALAPTEGVIILSGDAALFEDDRGSKKRMRYSCRFDTQKMRARLIRLESVQK